MQKAVVNATAFLCSGSSEYSAFEPFKQIQTGRIAIKVSYPAKMQAAADDLIRGGNNL